MIIPVITLENNAFSSFNFDKELNYVLIFIKAIAT